MSAGIVIVGAGPAGSACAAELARAGRDVVLVDRATFPRDKTCGDGLIPDAIGALDRLGLLGRVRAEARASDSATVHAGHGTALTLGSGFLTLPRRRLDALLVEHAVGRGTRLEEGLRVDDVVPHAQGATVQGRRAGVPIEVAASLVVLATGAAGAPPSLYRRAGVARPAASAVAARRYLRVGEAAVPSGLVLSYDGAVRPGYGWIFPLPGGVVNVGVADFRRGGRRQRLDAAWERFAGRFPAARALRARGIAVDRLQGAPLATGMERPARPCRPVVAIGEAAALTFPASGEGIGKALESGIALAHTLAPVAPDAATLAAAADDYATRWQRDRSELYRGYAAAERWLTRPLVSELIARGARRRPSLQRQIEGMVDETVDPRRLFSLRGVLGALLA